MAVNVYLIVHRSYDVEMLRRLEWKYMIIITTVTFIPAFVFLFIKTEDNGPMYGSVTVRLAQPPHPETPETDIPPAVVRHCPKMGHLPHRHVLRPHLVSILPPPPSSAPRRPAQFFCQLSP